MWVTSWQSLIKRSRHRPQMRVGREVSNSGTLEPCMSDSVKVLIVSRCLSVSVCLLVCVRVFCLCIDHVFSFFLAVSSFCSSNLYRSHSLSTSVLVVFSCESCPLSAKTQALSPRTLSSVPIDASPKLGPWSLFWECGYHPLQHFVTVYLAYLAGLLLKVFFEGVLRGCSWLI